LKNRAGRFLLAALVVVQASKGPVARYTAVADNVNNAGENVRIDILAWSSEADRDQMAAAWNLSPAPTRGAARGAPGAAAALGDPAARGGRGAAPARGGRGDTPARGGRGDTNGQAPTTSTPQASLLSALNAAGTAGILWTSDSLGYAIRYAYRIPQSGGGERVLLATERRLGGWNDLWRPASSPTDYEFTLIELRLNAAGRGEGKATLTGKAAVDPEAKTIALENYASGPVVFKNVAREGGR
jgi:hypothetical protein